MIGSTGTINYTNVALSFLTTVPLTLPGDKTVTLSSTFTGTSLAGTGTIATAPTIVFPPAGRSVVFADGGAFTASSQCAALGGDGCRLYKFVLAATGTYAVDFKWNGPGADMGLYRLSSTGAPGSTTADAHGQPDTEETGSITSLAAGTYFVAIVYYGAGSYGGGALAAPTGFTFRITQ